MNGTNLKVERAKSSIELRAKNPFTGDEGATAIFLAVINRLGSTDITATAARDEIYISYEGHRWIATVEREVELRVQGATEQVEAFKKSRELLKILNRREHINVENTIKEGL